jgi:hypothetical protein
MECVKHEYPARYCPIGIDILVLVDPFDVNHRINWVWDTLRIHFGDDTHQGIAELKRNFELKKTKATRKDQPISSKSETIINDYYGVFK